MVAPCIRVQIMHEIAAPHNQDPFIAQRREPFPDFVVKLRRLRLVDTQLNYGDIGPGENMPENSPGAMVKLIVDYCIGLIIMIAY